MSPTGHPASHQALDRGMQRLKAEISDIAAHRLGRCAGCGESVLATDRHVCAGRDVLHARCAAEADAGAAGPLP